LLAYLVLGSVFSLICPIAPKTHAASKGIIKGIESLAGVLPGAISAKRTLAIQRL
jgi:hypothetical protein